MRRSCADGDAGTSPVRACLPSSPVDYLVITVGLIVRFTLGVLATFLPDRFWPRVNARGIPVYPVLSPLIGLAVGIVIGVPYIYRHLVVSASSAQRMVAIAGSSDQQAAVAAAQTLSLFAALGVVLSPAGFLIVWLNLSSAARLLGAYLDEPFGDPLLTFLDWVAREVRRHATAAAYAIRARGRYGREEIDRVTDARDYGVADADVVVIASRPKEWTTGSVVLSPDGYYTVLSPFEVTVDGRERIGYPLVRKRDFEIVRKAFRYDVRRPD